MSDLDETMDLARRVFEGLSAAEIADVKRIALGCDTAENREYGRLMPTNRSDNTPWQIRECRGHYHITSGPPEWLDLKLAGDPFGTREEAERALEMVARGITETDSPRPTTHRKQQEKG